ncbi:MAG: YfaZ family outer membrane protein [Gammaproteobacteria bacterium]
MKRAAIFLCLALAAAGARAEGERIDVNLSDETLRGTYEGPLTGRLGGVYDLGVLLSDRDDGSAQQVHAGLLVTGDAGARQATVKAGVGGRVFLVNGGDNADGGGLALGGMVDARLPAFNRIGVIAYGYFAPDASTFGDFDSWHEYAVSADYQVLRGASVYLGWRQLKVDLDTTGTLTVDTGWHAGVRLNF